MPPKAAAPETILDGAFYYDNGDVYRGEYIKEGEIQQRHGKGCYVAFSEESKDFEELPQEIKDKLVPTRFEYDVIKLNGIWANDIFQSGEITFNNGAKYIGELEGLTYVSGGTYVFPDGTQYTGEFFKNLIHGIGTVTKPDGTVYGPGVYRNNYGEGLMGGQM